MSEADGPAEPKALTGNSPSSMPLTTANLTTLGAAAGDALAAEAKDWDSVSSVAYEALSQVSKKDTSELKAYQKPTRQVQNVLFAEMIALGYAEKDLSWARARTLLGTLVEQCKNFDPKSVDKAMIKRLKPYMKTAELQDADVAGSLSKACKSVAMWVQAVYEFGSS